MSRTVNIVEEKPCTSDARIPKIGKSNVLNAKTKIRATNETLDIVMPIKNTPVKGAVEKLKMPSLASLISLLNGYFVKPAARG